MVVAALFTDLQKNNLENAVTTLQRRARISPVFVAYLGETPVGTATLINGYVFNLGVHKSWRRRGIATTLLEHLAQHSAATGQDRLSVFAMTDAVDFYEKAGFKKGTPTQIWGKAVLTMSKMLNPQRPVKPAAAE